MVPLVTVEAFAEGARSLLSLLALSSLSEDWQLLRILLRLAAVEMILPYEDLDVEI